MSQTATPASILYISGARFNNPNLPRVFPLAVDGFLQDGLVCAAMPGGSFDSMADLSGNNTSWEIKGNPLYTHSSVIISVARGFESSLMETESLTYCTAWKRVRNAEKSAEGSFQIGMGYTLSCRNSPTDGSFQSNFVSNPSESGTYNLNVRGISCFGISATTGQTTAFELLETFMAGFPATFLQSEWAITCGCIDAAKAELRSITKSSGNDNYYNESYVNSTNTNTINATTFSNRTLGTLPISLGYDPTVVVPGVSEVAALGVWDRALSWAEMRRQVTMLAAALRGSKGIEV
jgi:hypothetical protein